MYLVGKTNGAIEPFFVEILQMYRDIHITNPNRVDFHRLSLLFAFLERIARFEKALFRGLPSLW